MKVLTIDENTLFDDIRGITNVDVLVINNEEIVDNAIKAYCLSTMRGNDTKNVIIVKTK